MRARTMKRALAMLLVLLLAVSVLPGSVLATSSPGAPFADVVTSSDASVSISYEGTVSYTDPGNNTFTNVPYYHVTVPSNTTSVKVTYNDTALNTNSTTAYGYYADIPGWSGGTADVTCVTTQVNGVTSTELTIPLSGCAVIQPDNTSSTRSFIVTGNTYAAFAPMLDSNEDYAPVNFFTFSVSSNLPPVVVSNAITADTVTVNTQWSIDLANFFTDPESDTITYSAKVDGVTQTLSGSTLSYTPSTTGQKTVQITASDSNASTNHQITLTVSGANTPPRLKTGVNATASDTATVGVAYVLSNLQDGNIFEDPDGDILDYTSYYYRRSTDQTNWSSNTYFEPALYGPTIMQITENTTGTYYYEFHCTDGTDVSPQTWTLTLNVTEAPDANITFYVGQDQNYSSNSTYPLIKLYETAGFDSELRDYIASYTISGTTHYMYTTDGYDISGSAENYVVTIDNVDYPLVGYNPITFTTSDFNGGGTASGTVVSNYNMFYAKIPSGRYSFRAYGKPASGGTDYSVYLGGHSLYLPTEENLSGTGGGTDIYLRLNSVYTTSKKTDDTYFTASDYDAKVFMPIAGGYLHHGAAYVSGNYTYYPFMLYSVGNASIFDIYVYPTDTNNYVFNQSINNTSATGSSVVTKSVAINQAVTLTVTVPTNGSFKLFFQYNNYNTQEIAPATENGNTLTFKIAKSNKNYTWRLTDTTGAKVTKAGYLASYAADGAFAPSLSSYTNKNVQGFDNLGTAVKTRDEAEIQVYLTDSGYEATNQTTRIRAYRLWQIINTDVDNIMIEPTFNYQVLEGDSDDISVVSQGNGNAQGNWLDVTPTTTDIVAVNYEALDVVDTSGSAGTHCGMFPATNPARTGVFVITNAAKGAAKATVEYNSNGAASSRPEDWDYNYDNWFYLSTDSSPTLDFKVTGATVVDYGVVTTNSNLVSSLTWYTTPLTADNDGYYHASLTPFNTANAEGGTVIIRMYDGAHYSYRLVRVAKVTATVTNATNPGADILPGNDVTVRFTGSYRGIYKYSGIFNPTTYYLRYTAGQDEYSATLAQYQQMDKVVLTATMPDENSISFGNNTSATVNLTNGYTYGNMYSAASPFATLYNMTDTGVGTNFNAVGVSFCLNRFPDVPITVQKPVLCNTVLNVTSGGNPLSGYTATLTDSDGVTQTPTGGTYSLTYGTYSYVVTKTGYKTARGSFTIDSSNINNNPLTVNIPMTALPLNAWDGSTKTAASLVNGYYEIDSGAKLAWFADEVNGGNRSIKGKLTDDIELADYQWTPIGGSSSSTAYTGEFDGNGKTVSGLYISYSSTTTSAPYKGLFGYVSGANIHDLTVEGIMTLTSTGSVTNAYSGGVVAYAASNTTLSHITANVNITVNRVKGNWKYVGGVAGYSAATSFTDCHNTGAISGYQYVGGIAGNTNASGSITSCSNTAAISGVSNYVGGLCAYSQGTITTSFNSGAVSGANYVGGLTGYNAKAITACYNWGAVTGTSSYVGGVTAYSYSANGGVSNCYNTGTVSGGTYAGAVVGYIANTGATMSVLHYLTGSCSVGIGHAAVSTQTATSQSDLTMRGPSFVLTMNTGIGANTFVDSEGEYDYPVFGWLLATV